jgi:catechol 2,3-dioxygenase-like lactoylglutathione lyase family enzyme
MSQILNCNITIMISDMDRSVLFYVDTLGFTLKNRYGNHWAEIEAPGLSIGLHPTSKAIIAGNNLQIGLSVTDLDNAVQLLKEKGVEFEIQDDQKVRLAAFKDPDGNMLYLAQTD